MTEELNVLSHLARVRLTARDRQTELKRLVTERGYLDDETMADFPPFFWRAEISNDLLDSHFTHMSESTLRNYAADCQRGVAFLKGHNHHELPLGYSLSGQYENTDRQRVIADFYTVAGLSETDNLISRMKAGLLRDVSVGFHGGSARCDICSQDFWECRHYPGLKYEEKDGDTVRTQIATFTIEDARLSEVSGVFDGSTPEAMILKAQRAAKAGDLTEKEVALLENRYRVALPQSKSFSVPEVQPTTKEKVAVEDKHLERLKAIVIDSGIVPEDSRDTLDEEATLAFTDKLAVRVKGLEKQAEEGRQYRTDLIAEAVSEGVRAYGNDFDKATYEATLNSAPLTTVKRMKADWKAVADKILPAGRASLDEATNERVSEVKPTSWIPDEAYR